MAVDQKLLREYAKVTQQVSEAERIASRGRKRLRQLEEIFQAHKNKFASGKLALIAEEVLPRFAWSSEKIMSVTSQKFHDELKEKIMEKIKRGGGRIKYKVVDKDVANLVKAAKVTRKKRSKK